MSLSEEVALAITEAVEKGLEKQNCACGLGPEALAELPHAMGMFKDVGNESYSRGIETARDHIKFLSAFRKRFNTLSMALGRYILIAVAGVLGLLLVMGFGAWLKSQG